MSGIAPRASAEPQPVGRSVADTTLRLLIAPASFKGSLSAVEAADCMARGARRAASGALLQISTVPLADGGEGTVAAIERARSGRRQRVTVRDPLGRPIDATFLMLDDGTAVLEMAAASGLPLLAPHERNPLHTSTHGTGDLIAAAVAAGARRLVIGVGGSATVDGGAGMAQALGVGLYDASGQALAPGGAALARLARIDLIGLPAALHSLPIDVLCDVRHPLCGPQGAAAVFGPQKGATPAAVTVLDSALAHFAAVIERDLGRQTALPLRELPGAGAAGGLAAGLVAFLGATLRPGIEVIMDLLGLAERLDAVDLVLSGEGQIDDQTAGGKVIAGLARLAQARGRPVVAIAGRVTWEAEALYDAGLTAAFTLADGPRSLAECERDAAALLERATETVMRLWLAARGNGLPSTPEALRDPL